LPHEREVREHNICTRLDCFFWTKPTSPSPVNTHKRSADIKIYDLEDLKAIMLA